MAVLINCKDLTLEYPGARVLAGVTLGVDEGDRIGIVGVNGSGKSSLLSVLAGEKRPDSGEVTLRSGTTVGLLAQRDTLQDTNTVLAAATDGRAEHEWAAERRTREIIDALIGDIPPHTLVSELSGGERRRTDLARLLIGSWDVLMLDEPTNHLDMAGITWLAAHLKNRWAEGKGALLLITHDRWFLDEVSEHMWELNAAQVRPYEGGYSAYIQQRVERAAAEEKAEQRRQNLARKELAWLARGAQARSTKPKFRVQAAHELIANEPPVRNELELKRVAMQRLGKQVVDLKGAGKSYGGSTVIRPLDWSLGAGERIGILGANGEGKSTLLGLVDGSITPTTGSVKIGASVRFGHLSQRLNELAPYEEDTVYAVLEQCKGYYRVDGKDLSPARLLERLGFSKHQLQNRVCSLSGGQRRRLQLLITLLAEPNVLLLDEPGNDLDTDMLAVMEDLLDTWPGTLLLVSHDRYLTERVTDDQYALIGGELRHMPGGVEQYLRVLAADNKETAPSARATKRTTPLTDSLSPSPAVNQHQAKKQLASLERKMSTLRGKLAKLSEQMHKADPTNYEELIRLGKEEQELRQQLSLLEDEWLELSE